MIVVFVNPVGAVGGAEKMLLTMMSSLQFEDPNLEIHLIVGTEGDLVRRAEALGVKVRVLPIPSQVNELGDSGIKGNKLIGGICLLLKIVVAWGAIAQYLKKYRQIIAEIDPDLIHSNGIKTHILTSLARIDLAVVWHIHDYYGHRPFMASVLRWMSDRAALGIAISESVAEDAQKVLPQLSINVIYNAIDTNYFQPRPAQPLALSGIIDDPQQAVKPTRVGLVATFARWKGHEIFLEAAAMIMRDRPSLNVRFYIIGAPIYDTKGSQFSEQELRQLASNLEISDRVEFLGFQDNIADVYLWLDIIVHASTKPEPFGLAIIEAMACGKPVIVARAGGAAELFVNDFEAVGIEPGDALALSVTIQYLICNSEQRQHLGENARKRVVKSFSQERLGKQLLQTYKLLWQPI